LQYTFAAIGPSAEWDYIGKISASIPTQRKVKDHVEDDINHFHRGKAHTCPEKEADIVCLQASYQQSKIHVYRPGRKVEAKDKFADTIGKGSEIGKVNKTLASWLSNRFVVKSTQEDWM
jgi:hypothetical protein